MSKHIERPDPKSQDYKSKDTLVAQLGNGEAVENALGGLGSTFETNPLLSRKQKEVLLQALKDSGLLEYQTGYLRPVLEAAEMGNPDDILGKTDETLDMTAWNIEKDAELQVKAIVAAKELTEVEPKTTEEIRITANLFNQAHLATQREAYLNERSWELSLSRFGQVEQSVFAERVDLGEYLVEMGMSTDDERTELEGLDFDGFKALRAYTEMYDFLVAAHLANGFQGTSIVERFQELQGVLHAGYSMGIRDAMEADQRLYDDSTF